MTDKTALWALWVSGGSLVVSIASIALARSAKRQAGQVGMLPDRNKTIDHIREAINDIDGEFGLRTTSNIREAINLSAPVFSRQVRNGLDQAHRDAVRLHDIPQPTQQDLKDIATLRKDLETLITQMTREARVVGWFG